MLFFTTVSCLNDHEMPCNVNITDVKIHGLCFGGGGGVGTSLEIGYLCFMKRSRIREEKIPVLL
jgi:hypothetical protein